MKIVLLSLIIIISTLIGNKAEIPQITCMGRRPFKSKDNTCSDFTDICIKKDDPDCESFLKSCEQCPPSNMTISTLRFILNNYNKQEQCIAASNILKSQINTMQNELNASRKSISADPVLALLILIIILVVFLAVVLLVEVRFKFITKTCEKHRHGRKANYRSLKRQKYDLENKEYPPDSSEGVLLKHVAKLLNDMDKKIDTLNSVINFQIEKPETPIKLHIDPNDNILQIKRNICYKVQDKELLDYKTMKLSYNDKLLDDNQFLLPLDPSISNINCKMDPTAYLSDIVILKLNCNIRVPESIQVLRDQTVDEVKHIISRIINLTEICLFYKKLNKMVQLNGKLTVRNSNLEDDCSVTVINKQSGVVEIHFICESTDSIILEYTNVELISDLKLKISTKLRRNVEEFSLFSTNGYLKEEKYIFECGLSNGCTIQYCSSIKSDKLQSFQKHCQGMLSTVYRAKYIKIGVEIILKRYTVESGWLLTKCKPLVSEMNKYQKINSNPRFIQVYGLHFNKNYIDIAMELMKGQSMRDFVNGHWPLKEIRIAKWSKQILESLKFLHDNKFTNCNMKASDIFIDSEDNIKISSFGLSKYFMGCDKKEMEEKFARNIIKHRFVAPEILTGEEYGSPADVWSFGEILLKMVTNKPPYSKKTFQERINDINHHRDIEYDSPNGLSSNLKSFLDWCLKGRIEDRATVKELLEHSFVQNL